MKDDILNVGDAAQLICYSRELGKVPKRRKKIQAPKKKTLKK
jgi:hypothetical protein